MTGLLPFVVSCATTVLVSVRIFLPTGLMASVQALKGDFALAFWKGSLKSLDSCYLMV